MLALWSARPIDADRHALLLGHLAVGRLDANPRLRRRGRELERRLPAIVDVDVEGLALKRIEGRESGLASTTEGEPGRWGARATTAAATARERDAVLLDDGDAHVRRNRVLNH